MANVTFKKSLVLLVLTLVFSLSSFAQKKGRVKEFTQEFPVFLVELGGVMHATDNSDLKSVFKQFKKKSEVLSISEKQIIMQISDKMLKKRLRAKPHFQQFLAALILATAFSANNTIF